MDPITNADALSELISNKIDEARTIVKVMLEIGQCITINHALVRPFQHISEKGNFRLEPYSVFGKVRGSKVDKQGGSTEKYRGNPPLALLLLSPVPLILSCLSILINGLACLA